MCKHISEKKNLHTQHIHHALTLIDMHTHAPCAVTALSASMTCGLTPDAALKPPYTHAHTIECHPEKQKWSFVRWWIESQG